MSKSAYMKQRREEARAEGICTRCFKTKVEREGRSVCDKCNDSLKSNLKVLRAEKGRCLSCCVKIESGSYCGKCTIVRDKSRIKRRNRRIANGQCAECGVDMEGEQYHSCSNCQEVRSERRRVRRSLECL